MMLSISLRIVLILMSIISCIYAIEKIRKSQMKIGEMVFWFLFFLFILILSIFPPIGIWMARLLGVESPVNLIYLIMIFMLIVKVFFLSIKNSKLEYQLWTLAQEIAIRENRTEEDRNIGKRL